MKTKRIIGLLLVLIMILSMAPVSVFADTTPTAVPPTSITIGHDAENLIGGKVIVKKGDTFKLTAYDQNGEETPVTWENTSYGGGGVTIDENTGEIEVTADVYSGSTSYLYFKAISTLNPNITKQITVQATGYLLGQYQKNPTVALSTDGQTAKTVSVTGGQSGYNIWSFDVPDVIAELAAEPGTGNSVKFNVYRPGTFDVTFRLNINEELTDTAKVTISGVAVEDNTGNRGKIYLSDDETKENHTAQLEAFVAEGRTVASWSSADETIATVDENGLVTAKGVGSVIINATDSEGIQGGIKVVVESEDTPYFEALEFMTTALTSGAWVKDETFAPTTLIYDLPIRSYSTSSLTLQATTLYDTDKYIATAEYTDVNGEKQSVPINSGKITTLANQPFDDSVMTITIADKNNAESKTVYTFNVTRPRDTAKVIKSSGIVLSPMGRALSATAYNGITEGTMQKADKSGVLTSGEGVSSTQYYYRTFIYDDAESFKLNLISSTAYAHIRYSDDDSTMWKELTQGGGLTDEIAVPEEGAAEILVQVIDDASYNANIKAGKDGFFETEPTEYKVWVDTVTDSNPVILTASVADGDWYPEFKTDRYSYWVMVENGAAAPTLTYAVNDGATVKIGTTTQTPDSEGNYSVALTTSQKSITVTSPDGSFSNTYKFGYKKKSKHDVPDKIVDYLCIGSQYTNASYGVNPEVVLTGSTKSLGNFGGYATFYYEEPITDNPNNKYGMDFYVIGNSSETNIDSMAELGQVYVSEDGESWYALAGSEHYEDKAIWDYTITYTKGSDGKSYWKDNLGNTMSNSAVSWPSASIYMMNNVADVASYTFTGVLFESQQGSIMGDSTNASFAASSKFGYTDYYASNISATAVTDINPYVENPSKANGFDVAWAVDGRGLPVDVSDKEFHYIKVATASNIWAGSFKEKSTEVTYVVRTTAQNTEVGETDAPTGVTISDGASSKVVNFNEGQTVYSVDLDDMKYVSVKVNGTANDDNIYVNNQRVDSGTSADGFRVTKENGETLVRVIVQNGDKEPVIYLLKLTSGATESEELVEGIKVGAAGSVREAVTKNGVTYTASVGHRIESIAINPVIAPEITYTINGEEFAESYELQYGENTFEIKAEDAAGKTQTVTLTVTREDAPVESGRNITVYFTLYGDEEHSDSEVHTYKNDRSSLPVWISRKAYTVPAEWTVLDVFEKALGEDKRTWRNDGGNYIFQIDALAEFDNGALSGWMYLLNGEHSELGVAEQSLKNGDNIIFHYTDDYTQEQGSEKWGSPFRPGSDSDETEAEEPEEDAENTTTGLAFSDVPRGAWYESAVAYVTEKNLFNGISETTFAPNDSMTRAMLVTVLYRLESAQADGESSFVDVSAGQWYSDAVAWAAENGVVTGVSDTHFAPNADITREQMAAIIYRYAKLKGYDVKILAELSGFADSSDISTWALEAIKWAHAAELINGINETTMSPKTGATRAQVAAILMRFCENVAK